MGERLGEYLIKAGRITEKQLAQVLERQVIMGGRLGTNLIELGYLSEDELVQFLSKKFNVPPVQATDLDQVQPDLMQLISSNTAEKYNVIPIKREKRILSVALLDPLDLEAIKELQFITGCVIKPYITSEARIQYVLERHYQINRQMRYISVLDDERKQPEAIDHEPAAKRTPTTEELETVLATAKEDWAEARNRDEATAAFLRAINAVLDHGILFLVKSGMITGWKGFPAYRESEITKLQFPLEDLQHFKEVVSTKSLYQGPAPQDLHYQVVFQALGSPSPTQILVIPILTNDNVVAVLYGDYQGSSLSTQSLEFIQKATRKVEMAFEILILRKKILDL